MVNRCTRLFTLLFFCAASLSAQKYTTQVFDPDIRTLQIYLGQDELQDPIIRMGADDSVTISFDQMSHNFRDYSYSLQLCNADWTPSDLLEIEYLQGFNQNKINDNSNISFNTTFDYTNYKFQIPNNDVKPLLSGNYVVKIYETDSPEKVVMTACFSIDENLVGIDGRVTGSTIDGVNTMYQQLNFTIDYTRIPINDPKQDLKILVRQNGRLDNQVFGIDPTYITPNSLHYEDNRSLIFEGGNEFQQIDFSHIRNFSGKIERIAFFSPYYHVETLPGSGDEYTPYQFSLDVNGRFKVHGQDIWSESEIDYSVVHFTFPRSEPFLDGSVYVAGYFNYNLLNNNNKMRYSFDRNQYELDVVLKNGGYNYQYLFLPAGQTNASPTRVGGSHWQTENDYKIYVYYRPYAGRHDRLIGIQTVNSVTN